MANSKIRLLYFDARGRAEVARLILTAAGKEFEDVRMVWEDWLKEKPNMPFQQLPVLEVDGQRFGQSVAINTFLAREFGLYGKTNIDGLKIDQVVQLVQDFISCMVKAHYEKDESRKAEMIKNLKEVDGPKFFGFFDKMLKENGSGYFVGESMTLADLSVFAVVDGMVQRGEPAPSLPNLTAMVDKVKGNDKIKAYLASRKKTEN